MDIRKIVVIIIVAVLFAIFTNSLADAMFNQPKYEDICGNDYYGKYPVPISTPEYNNNINANCNCTNVCKYIEPTQEEKNSCTGGGNLVPVSDTNGCTTSYRCDMCNVYFQDAQAKYNFKVFLVMSILGLIAIFLGIYLPAKTNPLHEMVGTGFMFGGLISIFVGTARYFADLARVLKPIVIFIELILVIWIAYKKLSDNGVAIIKKEPEKVRVHKPKLKSR